jgi:DNA-binding response OmpR family regulator
MRILLVEDHRRLRDVTSDALRSNGFAVDGVANAADADAAVRATAYDCIILDLGLPDRDGMDLLQSWRSRSVASPIVVLTAREGSEAAIDGLNSGADDFIRKPFVVDELVARIRAVLRRPGQPLSALLREGNIELSTTDRRVKVEGAGVDLTRREFGALELLLQRSGRVVSKSDIEQSLYAFGEELGSNAIEVLVHRLRKRLVGCGADVEIHTLRGIGYMLAAQAA